MVKQVDEHAPSSLHTSREELETKFKQFDTNHDGELSLDEVLHALQSIHVGATKKDAEKMVEYSDKNHDHLVCFDEFVKYVWSREDIMLQTFRSIDSDRDGYLSVDEIKVALKKSGKKLKNDSISLKQLMLEMDKDGSGNISFKEFRTALFLMPDVSTADVFDLFDRTLRIDIGESLIIPSDPLVLDDDSNHGNHHQARLLPKALVTLVSGSIAGATSRTVTAPMDRVKTMLQANIPGVTGITQGLRQIYAEGGFRAYFRGNGANCIKIAPETAIKFLVYDRAKSWIAADVDKVKPWERFVAGGFSGVCSQTSVYVLEIAKTKLAVSPSGTYSGIADVIRKTYQSDGIRGLFRGLTPSLLGIIPYAGVDLMVYSSLKDYYVSRMEKPPSPMTVLVCGAISSTCGQIVAYPLQVVRTRLQLQSSLKPAATLASAPVQAPTSPKYTGMVDCFRKIISSEGVSGLYRGIGPNFLKAIPAISISYLIYEQVQNALEAVNHQHASQTKVSSAPS